MPKSPQKEFLVQSAKAKADVLTPYKPYKGKGRGSREPQFPVDPYVAFNDFGCVGELT
jgi:hypothetical protein